MKIDSLKITNFRGISDISMENLGSMVIIAGQNGSGKSCLFDAIRLLKSVYGGYQANEWQQWMGEFQISLTDRSSDFISMFNDQTKNLSIICNFRLSEEERLYVKTNAHELIREKIWRTILPEAYSWGGLRMAMFAAQFRDREPEVAQRTEEEYKLLVQELANPTIHGEFSITPGESPKIVISITLSVIFSTYRPEKIGVIDYHGAQRHYGRENVQGINLNLDANEQQRSQSALYNYSIKYTNVKSEMAASYVKEILTEQAGIPREEQSSITNTLKDLFSTFFPDKKFLGPQPTVNGGLNFPVETATGQHDLDELSSGEKEILYGYLRIRNSAPRYSIILLDEPELHLNPRLIRGLPQFYKKYLGEALDNQIWLVTHSDALLREVIGEESYNVFHMLPCGKKLPNESQLKKLSVTADLDLALIDLVGDLASYTPNGKVIIFEGGGDSDFDQRVTATLFPELQEHANLVSGSNKIRVKALHETLSEASKKGHLPFKFYSITDRDCDATDNATSPLVNMFTWDVYHIENYLLDASFILKVLESLGIALSSTESEIKENLRQCAQDIIPQLVRHELAVFANVELVKAIDTGTNPNANNLTDVLFEAISRSKNKIDKICSDKLNKDCLIQHENEIKRKYTESLTNGDWTSIIPGRPILKRFAGKYVTSIPYEAFRNLILSKMKDQSYQPESMKTVIDTILSS